MTDRPFANSRPVFPTNGIILVGVCAAGKTTASELLDAYGIPAKPVAQEHSFIKSLYRRSGRHPLVVLEASWATVHRRRRINWDWAFYREEWRRVSEARNEAGLILQTDVLSREQVAATISQWWDRLFGLDRIWPSIPSEYHPAVRNYAARGGTFYGAEWVTDRVFLRKLADDFSARH